ncbi:MAG: gliding motility-associated C-terminal domain-containing protein [Bacteroidales bacterium]|nr:gliding motility-associated C-terminal domain-containing protein [Bacteroidales bacterium]
MKKIVFLILFLLTCFFNVSATHQRAAEIIYRHISGLTYEIKLITYANPTPANDSRDFLLIKWGDGNETLIPRIVKTSIAPDVIYNVYIGTHTYPGVGTYSLTMEDPNRNFGVVNIPNSIDVPIFVESELVINPFLGVNNSVQLLNQPIDYGCVDKIFMHNPGAYDIDGDSLSYKFVDCRGTEGEAIPGYILPNEVLPEPQNTFTINSYNGDIIWDVPNLQGEFNIAFIVEEWRNGVRIGMVTRDMQVKITTCDENPPVIDEIPDTCIEAGNTLIFDVSAIGIDGDEITLTATGGPFEVNINPASIDPDPATGIDIATTTFTWETACQHVQKQAWQVYFKAEDDGTPVSLVDFQTANITVIAPAPENPLAEALGNTIRLSWEKSICENATGYKIYRRNGYYGFVPGYCETGVPPYTGYIFVDEINNVNTINYTDDNHGSGLIHGIDYCYMITAFFSDGAESYASLETCASLKRDLPVITNISNDSSNNLNGNCFVAWSKPVDLDLIQFPGPYIYKILRSEGQIGSNLVQISTNYGLNDTLFFDEEIDLNSSNSAYSYRIDLYSTSYGDIGSSHTASSIFLSIYETDDELQLSWNFNTPWNNSKYIIYRREQGQTEFDSLSVTNKTFYNDVGLINGNEYCYYIKAIGSYSSPGFVDPIINFSQKACGIPVDNVASCPPVLSVSTNCDLIENRLSWTNPNYTCADDVTKYHIYYSPNQSSDFSLIDSTLHPDDTIYYHSNIESVTACYVVTAIDSVGNQSDYSNVVCVDYDVCPVYRLPNVFTPNGDGHNDYFVPFPESIAAVENVAMSILNRWGVVVYQTTDPQIKWDGKNHKSNQNCSQGVYFYVCDVFEITLNGLQKRTLKGSITIFR